VDSEAAGEGGARPIVAASAASYGCTITLWSTGAIVIRADGLPRLAEVFPFAAGALCGFGLMGLLARGALTSMESLGDAPVAYQPVR
jgi:hypothetical protein